MGKAGAGFPGRREILVVKLEGVEVVLNHGTMGVISPTAMKSTMDTELSEEGKSGWDGAADLIKVINHFMLIAWGYRPVEVEQVVHHNGSQSNYLDSMNHVFRAFVSTSHCVTM